MERGACSSERQGTEKTAIEAIANEQTHTSPCAEKEWKNLAEGQTSISRRNGLWSQGRKQVKKTDKNGSIQGEDSTVYCGDQGTVIL